MNYYLYIHYVYYTVFSRNMQIIHDSLIYSMIYKYVDIIVTITYICIKSANLCKYVQISSNLFYYDFDAFIGHPV